MKKRIFSLLTAIFMVIGLVLPCYGEDVNPVTTENDNIIVDNIIYSSDMKTIIGFSELFDEDIFTVPEGVTEIGEMAFYASQLKTIEIANSVKKIGKNAFWKSEIECVKLGKKSELIDIGENAFSDSKLKVIFLPENLKNISDSALKNCQNIDLINIWIENEQDAWSVKFGDTNADNFVTAADARLALRIAAKLENATKYSVFTGDLNRDGRITAADARQTLRIAAKYA